MVAEFNLLFPFVYSQKIIMKYLFIVFLVFTACKQKQSNLTAQQIVDKTIENAGGNNYEHSNIEFTFRKIKYTSNRNNGIFEFTRGFSDSLGYVKDVLDNSGFIRYINGEKQKLPDTTASKYANSVNSVHYFIQLPFGLNDKAVQKKLVDTTQIKGQDYYAIEVSFAKENGGSDHDDLYMYWINKKDFTVDYFAYKYYSGEGGIRFREAYNPRKIGGIRFVDYKNYKAEPWENVELKDLSTMFDNKQLELLSDIKNEAISVKRSNE